MKRNGEDDGYCESSEVNSPECYVYDDGECEEFNQKYPDFDVWYHPFLGVNFKWKSVAAIAATVQILNLIYHYTTKDISIVCLG